MFSPVERTKLEQLKNRLQNMLDVLNDLDRSGELSRSTLNVLQKSLNAFAKDLQDFERAERERKRNQRN